jgi:hypothetical protein
MASLTRTFFAQLVKDDDGEELPDETLKAEAAALG